MVGACHIADPDESVQGVLTRRRPTTRIARSRISGEGGLVEPIGVCCRQHQGGNDAGQVFGFRLGEFDSIKSRRFCDVDERRRPHSLAIAFLSSHGSP